MAFALHPPATPPSAAPRPQPPAFDQLAKRFGMTRQDVYALALLEALTIQFNHRPRQMAPTAWEIDSRSAPGEKRTVTQVGKRLRGNCPAAKGDQAVGRPPRICTHTASVHMECCKRLGIEPPVPPMPAWVLRHDPSPEARAVLALIERPRTPTAPAERAAPGAPGTKVREPAEVLR